MENKILKRINLNHIFMHVSYQALAGIVYGFGIYMLLSSGFNSAQAGWCMAGGNLLSLLIQPTISNFLDNSKKVSVFKMMIFNTAILTILFLLNLLLKTKSIALSLVFVAIVSLYSSCEPLVNSLSNVFISNGIQIEFGLARSIGSLTYGFISALFGVLSERFSYLIVLLGGFILAILFTFVSLGMKDVVDKANINIFQNKSENIISYREFFKSQKHFIFICIALVGIFYSYTSIDNFMLLVVEKVNGNSADMGVILGLKAFLEFFGIIFFVKIIKKIKIENILIFASFAFVLKALVCYLADNIIYIYLAQIIQMISFAFILPGMVEYVNRTMSKNEAIRGQAFFTMSISLGSMFSSIIGGSIANSISTSAMENFALLIGLISAILFSYLIREK